VKRPNHKALGLILPLAAAEQRARASRLIDDGALTAGIQIVVSTMAPAYSPDDVALVRACGAAAHSRPRFYVPEEGQQAGDLPIAARRARHADLHLRAVIQPRHGKPSAAQAMGTGLQGHGPLQLRRSRRLWRRMKGSMR
jgi:hypothetical protein